MNHDHYEDNYIRNILQSVESIAIIGASPKPDRASYRITQYLIDEGYQVFPTNPGHAGREICDVPCFATLSDIPQPIHMIDIFRNSAATYSIVEEALEMNPLPKVIWMQLDIRNDAAAKLAEKNGLQVVMNRCPKIEYKRLFN